MDRFIVAKVSGLILNIVNLKSNMDRFIDGGISLNLLCGYGFKIQYG